MAQPKARPQTPSFECPLLRSPPSPSPGGKLLIVENASQPTCSTAAFLQREGFQTQTMTGLAEVMKQVRILTPAAVIIDLDLTTVGTDHAIRVMRLVHPAVPLLALSSTLGRQACELAREFNLPLLSTPCNHAALMAALEVLGICSALNSPVCAADQPDLQTLPLALSR